MKGIDLINELSDLEQRAKSLRDKINTDTQPLRHRAAIYRELSFAYGRILIALQTAAEALGDEEG